MIKRIWNFLKRIWKDPVWSKVIATAIIVLFAAIWASFKGWWPVIGTGIVSTWRWFGDRSALPNWLLVLLFLAMIAVVLALAMAIFASLSWNKPTWKDYREDHFEGLKWQWRYSTDGKITELTARCPTCDCQLSPSETLEFGIFQTTLYCSHCREAKANLPVDRRELRHRVSLLIERKLHNGEWKALNG